MSTNKGLVKLQCSHIIEYNAAVKIEVDCTDVGGFP